MIYKSTAVIIKEGRWFVAKSLELGVASQGKTIPEATANLREAVELYLENSPRERKFLSTIVPLVTSFEVYA
ncbi:MAG TPA: type II toxin-antitoxin system HicB family antitoxin [Candidatus Paceibacterota bacterium]